MSGRLLILGLMILLTGCESFTLIDELNLGDTPAAEETDSGTGEVDEEDEPDCWPSAAAAVAEMRRHGYSKETWTETALWFTALEPVRDSLPECQ